MYSTTCACKCFCCLSASGLCFLLPVAWSRSCNGRTGHPAHVQSSSVLWLCCRALPETSLPGALPSARRRGGWGTLPFPSIPPPILWVVVLQAGLACAQGPAQPPERKILCRGQDQSQHPWEGSELLTVSRLTKRRCDRASTSGSSSSCSCGGASLPGSSRAAQEASTEPKSPRTKWPSGKAEQRSMCPSLCSWPSPVLGVTNGLKVTVQGLCPVCLSRLKLMVQSTCTPIFSL